MKDLFIITSALMVPNSDTISRAIQTSHTIDSIIVRVPDAEIWLCDSATVEIPQYILDILPLERIKLIQFHNDPVIHEMKQLADMYEGSNAHGYVIQKAASLGLIKNATESYVMLQLLKNDLSKFNKVFKISGRYALSSQFNISSWDNNGKATLNRAVPGTFPEILSGTTFSHYCMLWSFCPSIKNKIIETFEKIHEEVILFSKTGQIIDIEHGLYKHLDRELVHELDQIGIIGIVNSATGPISFYA